MSSLQGSMDLSIFPTIPTWVILVIGVAFAYYRLVYALCADKLTEVRHKPKVFEWSDIICISWVCLHFRVVVCGWSMSASAVCLQAQCWSLTWTRRFLFGLCRLNINIGLAVIGIEFLANFRSTHYHITWHRWQRAILMKGLSLHSLCLGMLESVGPYPPHH